MRLGNMRHAIDGECLYRVVNSSDVVSDMRAGEMLIQRGFWRPVFMENEMRWVVIVLMQIVVDAAIFSACFVDQLD